MVVVVAGENIQFVYIKYRRRLPVSHFPGSVWPSIVSNIVVVLAQDGWMDGWLVGWGRANGIPGSAWGCFSLFKIASTE